jgi:RNase adapter protein RapZ
MKLVIVTGLSGSGKSIALHTLEDLGYYCIDNLPMFLLQHLAQELAERRNPCYRKTAVGIDARGQVEDLKDLPTLVQGLRGRAVACEIVFLDAQDETLLRRFSETRRKHPLSGKERPLEDAIRLERRLLGTVRSNADLCIDTSNTTQHQLRDLIRHRLDERPHQGIALLCQSFGYKYGVPRDADFVFDVRCLPNPYWELGLRPLTGRDAEVAKFLQQDPTTCRLQDQLARFVEEWLPVFEADGRTYLTVALGCTGGQHRSVFMAEWLAERLRKAGREIQIRHRELQ